MPRQTRTVRLNTTSGNPFASLFYKVLRFFNRGYPWVSAYCGENGFRFAFFVKIDVFG
jgi:hypothetical protein